MRLLSLIVMVFTIVVGCSESPEKFYDVTLGIDVSEVPNISDYKTLSHFSVGEMRYKELSYEKRATGKERNMSYLEFSLLYPKIKIETLDDIVKSVEIKRYVKEDYLDRFIERMVEDYGQPERTKELGPLYELTFPRRSATLQEIKFTFTGSSQYWQGERYYYVKLKAKNKIFLRLSSKEFFDSLKFESITAFRAGMWHPIELLPNIPLIL